MLAPQFRDQVTEHVAVGVTLPQVNPVDRARDSQRGQFALAAVAVIHVLTHLAPPAVGLPA